MRNLKQIDGLLWTSAPLNYQDMIISDLNYLYTHTHTHTHTHTLFLPGKSQGQRSLVGCSPWGRKESDTTERLHFHFSLSCIGEGNGNPLQCSCLKNPRDGGAWWAAVSGVAQSRTRLKRLSSSSIYILCIYNIYYVFTNPVIRFIFLWRIWITKLSSFLRSCIYSPYFQ